MRGGGLLRPRPPPPTRPFPPGGATGPRAPALLLAWAGGRWERQEFGRLVYPVMALGAYRMIGVDLHQDRTGALFLSLLLYGGALILLPKLIRSRALV